MFNKKGNQKDNNSVMLIVYVNHTLLGTANNFEDSSKLFPNNYHQSVRNMGVEPYAFSRVNTCIALSTRENLV